MKNTYLEYNKIINNYKIKSKEIWNIIKNQKNKEKQSSEIPKVIIQYWDKKNDVPDDVLKCMETWKKHCSDNITYLLFDQKSALEFIKNNFNEKYVRAFEKCIHPALQSDYFRLCYILIKGGAYIDADDECLDNNIEHLFRGNRLKLQAMCYDINHEHMVKAREAYSDDYHDNRIYYVNNNPLIAPKNNPIIEKALCLATDNLLNNRINDFQAIAGPGNLVNSIIWCKLTQIAFEEMIDITIDWDNNAISNWSLDYRKDDRNWRNFNLKMR